MVTFEEQRRRGTDSCARSVGGISLELDAIYYVIMHDTPAALASSKYPDYIISALPTRSRSSRPSSFKLQATRLNSNYTVLTGLSGLACWSPLLQSRPQKKLLHVTCYLLRSFPPYQHSLFVPTIHLTSSPQDRSSFWERDHNGVYTTKSKNLGVWRLPIHAYM